MSKRKGTSPNDHTLTIEAARSPFGGWTMTTSYGDAVMETRSLPGELSRSQVEKLVEAQKRMALNILARATAAHTAWSEAQS